MERNKPVKLRTVVVVGKHQSLVAGNRLGTNAHVELELVVHRMSLAVHTFKASAVVELERLVGYHTSSEPTGCGLAQ